MGDGYHILVWDGFGGGLVLINPRLHTEGLDVYNNPRNWWPCKQSDTIDSIIEHHKLRERYTHYKIIRSSD